ncbi:hypothetical protein LB553_01030 [Mesorhizobium sp. CA8]|uniref:hypothetical protein n=1 Tax=Mesorhizobium sp. CA8 TaxID=2876637 RepID=UPI001CC99017|nr:hypothetical protein [Mesorhizobium sp. CA8]MBZ9759471.1 hypothetical protein [Mesorhizobium sp. CA8]
MTAYDLAGDFEEKCKEASSMQDIMWLACDLAHKAILAERHRCTLAVTAAFEEQGGRTALMEAIFEHFNRPEQDLQ